MTMTILKPPVCIRRRKHGPRSTLCPLSPGWISSLGGCGIHFSTSWWQRWVSSTRTSATLHFVNWHNQANTRPVKWAISSPTKINKLKMYWILWLNVRRLVQWLAKLVVWFDSCSLRVFQICLSTSYHFKKITADTRTSALCDETIFSVQQGHSNIIQVLTYLSLNHFRYITLPILWQFRYLFGIDYRN